MPDVFFNAEPPRVRRPQAIRPFGPTCPWDIAPVHTLGRALADLISAAAAGELKPSFYHDSQFISFEELLDIRFHGQWPQAELLCDGSGGERKPGEVGRLLYSPEVKGNYHGDLRQDRIVTSITITKLGKLFA